MYNPLKRNYQKLSTNRFVVDSTRFWRPEFHPRFSELFEFADFENVFNDVNEQISFILSDPLLSLVSVNLYEYFSGFRFAHIPAKNPASKGQFLSDMFFTLLDILPQISFTNYPVDDDDFNVVTKRAETGKNDTTRTAVNEINKSATKNETKADILTRNEMGQTDSSNVENIDDMQKRNAKGIDDVFLSPQDQGRLPITSNEQYSGVDGIELQAPGDNYTTNVANRNEGETTLTQTNTSSNAKQSDERLNQDNDIRTAQTFDTATEANQDLENTTAKDDRYVETLSFDKAGKLLEFAELADKRLWNEILRRLSRWVLQVDIATAERNYNECPIYE